VSDYRPIRSRDPVKFESDGGGGDWRVILLISTTFLLVVAVAFLAGRCSSPDVVPPIVPEPDVDAGPGEREIADRLDAAVQAEVERLERLEVEHAAEVAALTEAERAEYEATRARGRGALASWFKERSRALLVDGGL
jgi:hypothetical protein